MNLTDIEAVRLLLTRHGFSFSKSLGQNFLIAGWVPERVAEESGIGAENGVLEIGPGIGCLTAQLAKHAAKVVSVELDKTLKHVLAETLADYSNVEIIYGDILRQNIPELVKDKFSGLRPAVCANLPYNVTTPVLTALIESGCFDSITVMVQREVARRICAREGTEDYGAFTVFVQWYCGTELLFDVSPDCFVPQPKVTSSVIRLTRRQTPLCKVADEELLFKIVRGAFNQRRKTLVNALSASFGNMTKSEISELVTNCGFDEKIRGERLSISDFCVLTNEFGKK